MEKYAATDLPLKYLSKPMESKQEKIKRRFFIFFIFFCFLFLSLGVLPWFLSKG